MAKSIGEPYQDANDRDNVVLTPVEARQGSLGRPVLIVLVVGLLLALATWAMIEVWGTAIAPIEGPAVTTPEVTPNTPAGTDTFDDNPPADTKVEPAPVIVNPTNP